MGSYRKAPQSFRRFTKREKMAPGSAKSYGPLRSTKVQPTLNKSVQSSPGCAAILVSIVSVLLLTSLFSWAFFDVAIKAAVLYGFAITFGLPLVVSAGLVLFGFFFGCAELTFRAIKKGIDTRS